MEVTTFCAVGVLAAAMVMRISDVVTTQKAATSTVYRSGVSHQRLSKTPTAKSVRYHTASATDQLGEKTLDRTRMPRAPNMVMTTFRGTAMGGRLLKAPPTRRPRNTRRAVATAVRNNVPIGVAFPSGAANIDARATRAIAAETERAFTIPAILAVPDNAQPNVGFRVMNDTKAPAGSRLVTASLIVAGIIHLVPITGVLGADRLAALYGLPMAEPNLVILMRHRAVLFGLLGAFMVYAAFRPALQLLAFAGGFVSVFSFFWIVWSVGGYNDSVARIVAGDVVAFVSLVIGLIVRARPR